MKWVLFNLIKEWNGFLIWLIGSLLITLTFAAILFDNITLAGGDLGLSVSHASQFFKLLHYTWNHLAESGSSIMTVLWYPYYLFITIISSVAGIKTTTIIFFILPLLIAFSLSYYGVRKLLKNDLLALLAALVLIYNPLSSRAYLSVTLHPTYAVYAFSGFFIYLYFSIIFSNGLRVKNLVLAAILTLPFMLISFSNPGYGLPVLVVGTFMIVFALISSKDRRKVVSSIAIVSTLILALSTPFLLVYSSLASNISGSVLPRDVDYILRYVEIESKAIKFYVNFFPIKEEITPRIITIVLSLLVIFLGFALPAVKVNKASRELKMLFLLATLLYVFGITLSKGIQEPLGIVNMLFYELLAPYSFAFRSPFSKFSIITVIGIFLGISLGLKLLEERFRKKRNMMKYFLMVVLIAMMLSQYYIVVKNQSTEWSLLKNIDDLNMLNLLAQLRQSLSDDGRALIFPLNYGVFSEYKLNRGFYKGAANEYILLEKPVLVNYIWGKNKHLKELIVALETNDYVNILRLVKLYNIKYAIYIPFKVDINPWDDRKLFNILINYTNAICHEQNDSIKLCRLSINTSYFYQDSIIDKPEGGYEVRRIVIWPSSEVTIVPVTVTKEDIDLEKEVIMITIPKRVREGAVDISFKVPLNIPSLLDLKINLELFISKPEYIDIIYLGLNTIHGYVTYLLPRPYTQIYNITLSFDNIIKYYNFDVCNNVIALRLSIWKKSENIETIQVKLMKLTLAYSSKEVLQRSLSLKPLKYEYQNPTLWKLNINSVKPFTLVFAVSYDPLWEAQVYKNDMLVDKIRSFPVHDVINGFWINETGNLTIVIRYIPQTLFELGLNISMTTFALCVFYLVWEWRRFRGDRWALWLENFLRGAVKRFSEF
jgi:hypothetical protein